MLYAILWTVSGSLPVGETTLADYLIISRAFFGAGIADVEIALEAGGFGVDVHHEPDAAKVAVFAVYRTDSTPSPLDL